MKDKIFIAKYIQVKLYQQLIDSECVVSSKYDIPNTLLQLGIQVIQANGSDRSLFDIYGDLSKAINNMEVEYEHTKQICKATFQKVGWNIDILHSLQSKYQG